MATAFLLSVDKVLELGWGPKEGRRLEPLRTRYCSSPEAGEVKDGSKGLQAGPWGAPNGPVCLVTVITHLVSQPSHFLKAWARWEKFKGINEACSYAMGPFTPPPASWGACSFLYFGSELGDEDGASDPSADGRASSLKKSAGEWCRGGPRLACAPGGHLPALRTQTHTRTHAHTRVHTRTHKCPQAFPIIVLFLHL